MRTTQEVKGTQTLDIIEKHLEKGRFDQVVGILKSILCNSNSFEQIQPFLPYVNVVAIYLAVEKPTKLNDFYSEVHPPMAWEDKVGLYDFYQCASECYIEVYCNKLDEPNEKEPALKLALNYSKKALLLVASLSDEKKSYIEEYLNSIEGYYQYYCALELLVEECDLLLMDDPPQKKALNSLPITAAAYIRIKKQLFYVNKTSKECIQLNITPIQLRHFDQEMRVEELYVGRPRKLSDTELSNITSITGHTMAEQHQKLLFQSPGKWPFFSKLFSFICELKKINIKEFHGLEKFSLKKLQWNAKLANILSKRLEALFNSFKPLIPEILTVLRRTSNAEEFKTIATKLIDFIQMLQYSPFCDDVVRDCGEMLDIFKKKGIQDAVLKQRAENTRLKAGLSIIHKPYQGSWLKESKQIERLRENLKNSLKEVTKAAITFTVKDSGNFDKAQRIIGKDTEKSINDRGQNNFPKFFSSENTLPPLFGKKPNSNIPIEFEEHSPKWIEKDPSTDDLLISQVQNLRVSNFENLTEDNLQQIIYAQREFNQKTIKWLESIAQRCTAFLGTPPCSFNWIAIGSLSRYELSLYSDLDIALLIENIQYKTNSYFRQWINLMRFNQDLVGGFPIDNGDIGYLFKDRQPFLNTPEGLAEYIKYKNLSPEDNVDFYPQYSLRCSLSLYSSDEQGKELLIRFKNQFKQQLKTICSDSEQIYRTQSQSDWQGHQRSFENNCKLQKPDLKEYYISPLVYWCLDIALFHYDSVEYLEEITILNILQSLRKNFSKNFINNLSYNFKYLQYLRLGIQAKTDQSGQDISNLNQEQHKHLDDIMQFLQLLYNKDVIDFLPLLDLNPFTSCEAKGLVLQAFGRMNLNDLSKIFPLHLIILEKYIQYHMAGNVSNLDDLKNSEQLAMQLIELLPKELIDFEEKNNDGKTLLHLIAQSGSHELFKKLFHAGVNIYEEDKNGNVALHLASKGYSQFQKYYNDTLARDYLEDNYCFIIDQLINRYSDEALLEQANKLNQTPLWYALEHSRSQKIVKKHLDKGARFPADDNGSTALHLAVSGQLNNFKLTSCLLKNGYANEVNKQNKQGDTPLHLVVNKHSICANDKEKEEIVLTIIMLINNGADANIKNNSQQTPGQLTNNPDIKVILNRNSQGAIRLTRSQTEPTSVRPLPTNKGIRNLDSFGIDKQPTSIYRLDLAIRNNEIGKVKLLLNNIYNNSLDDVLRLAILQLNLPYIKKIIGEVKTIIKIILEKKDLLDNKDLAYYAQGLLYEEDGKVDEACKAYRKGKSYPAAERRLGIILNDRPEYAENPEEAHQCLENAASKNNIKAMCILGEKYEYKDPQQAYNWYHKAELMGDKKSRDKCEELLNKNKMPSNINNLHSAIRCADEGKVKSLLNNIDNILGYGRVLRLAEGAQILPDKGNTLVMQLKNGFLTAYWNGGEKSFNTLDVKDILPKLPNEGEDSTNQDLIRSIISKYNIYVLDDILRLAILQLDINKNLGKVKKIIKNILEKNDLLYNKDLTYYVQGLLYEKDGKVDEACKAYRKGKRYPAAERRLGIILNDHPKYAENPEEGHQCLKNAAKDNIKAMYILGQKYEDKDPQQAYNWYHKAELMGDENSRIKCENLLKKILEPSIGRPAPKSM
jgi:TPR repeat protein/ankyrin repeat protein